MKSLRKILLSAILCIAACACTHNNGDIGPWYGLWKLESIEADGLPLQDYHGNMFWSFQNNILCLNLQDSDGLSYYQRWATWKQEGTTLLLDFTHYDGNSPVTDGNFAPFPILGLGKDAVNSLTIEKLSSDRLILTYPSGGQQYTCRLRKWG